MVVSGTSCAHPACPGTPAAWLQYDYQARCAWLYDRPSEATRVYQWPLCKRHADGLRVPRGWCCIDQRAKWRWDGWPGWGEPAPTAGPGPERKVTFIV